MFRVNQLIPGKRIQKHIETGCQTKSGSILTTKNKLAEVSKEVKQAGITVMQKNILIP